MFEVLFYMVFAFVVLSGVVYFPIFFWLKNQQESEIVCCQPNSLKYGLKAEQLRIRKLHP